MSKLIITTVGTSTISNKKCLPPGSEDNIEELINGIPLNSVRDIKEIIDKTADNIRRSIANEEDNKFLSAEIASLRAFKNSKELELSSDDVIALLSTDTEDGKFCAQVNKQVLDTLDWGKVAGPMVITGMKTRKTEEDEDISKRFIDAGLKSMKKVVEEVLGNNQYDKKYFNITGGFKATIPFATILAFEKGISLIYLYEESSDLIVISPPSGFYYSFDELRNSTFEISG
ncbi:putative CRISPR-associated protein [Dehalococcoidia bacterium]|nr:putative CRISPR-associated protein [Dehalococcoidia bacterium]